MESEVSGFLDPDDAPRTFVRIYQLPHKLTAGYCFGAGRPIEFRNVDWFEALIEADHAGLTEFIKTKQYYSPDRQYLVLADDPSMTFTIGEIAQ